MQEKKIPVGQVKAGDLVKVASGWRLAGIDADVNDRTREVELGWEDGTGKFYRKGAVVLVKRERFTV